MSKEKEVTLEGKLYGAVKKGDLIVLSADMAEIGGFVTYYDLKYVGISFEQHFKAEALLASSRSCGYRVNGWGRGDCTYYLSGFKEFKVLSYNDWESDLEKLSVPDKKARFSDMAMRGNLIHLYAKQLEVAGFLMDYTNTQIVLAHKNPFVEEKYRNVPESRPSIGDDNGVTRVYNFNKFNLIRVAQQIAHSPEEQKAAEQPSEPKESIATAR